MAITYQYRATGGKRVVATALVLLVSASPISATGLPKAPMGVATAPGHPSPRLASEGDSLSLAIQQLVTARPMIDGITATNWRRMQRLYRENGHASLWSDSANPTTPVGARARALIAALTEASAHALRLDAYPLAELHQALQLAQVRAPSPEKLARADVMLTAAFVAYASDLLTGQVDPRTVNREWHIDPQQANVDSALSASLQHAQFADVLSLLRPQDPEYGALVEELARYRRLVAAGGWPGVPSMGVLHPGDTSTAGALGLLMGRLHAEGYADPGALVPAGQPRLSSSARHGHSSDLRSGSCRRSRGVPAAAGAWH